MPSARPSVYVFVRLPKTGGTSLSQMILDSRPGATLFGMPASPDPDNPPPPIERLRAARSRTRVLLRRYRTVSLAKAWKHVDAHARDGDLVFGHLRFGDPVLPNLHVNYFTLLREPLARILSDYNYSRHGIGERNVIQRAYVRGRLKAAVKYSFSGYLSYLDEHTLGNANVMAGFVYGREKPSDPLAFLRANYFHFGVLEQFERFTDELGRKMGATIATRRDNVTPRREATAISSADRPVFERICGRDIALYEATLAHLQATARQ